VPGAIEIHLVLCVSYQYHADILTRKQTSGGDTDQKQSP